MLKVLELQKGIDEKRAALKDLESRDFETRAADIEKRLAELTTEATEADKAAIEEEAQALADEKAANEAEKDTVRAEIEKLEKELDAELEKAPKDEPAPEDRAKDMKGENRMSEFINSREHIEAFAKYIRSEGNDMQARALLTENATGGTVAVPSFVYEIVKTAWDREGIIRRVKKAAMRGNVKVQFEISATGATVHTEGGDPVPEETLVLGIVNLVPEDIKKWVSVSDKVLELGAEDFLRYIYDEVTYQIAKKAADQLLADIVACGTQSTATMVGVPVVTVTAVGVGTIASAMSYLSGEASDPIVVLNRQSWGAFKAAQYAASFSIDPFEGLEVEFNNSLKSATVATTGDTIAIVGDFGMGALANFPNGEAIDFKFDDVTEMTNDLVRILGKRLGAIKPVAPNAFVKIVKG